jgi:hypothetical protein
MTIHIDLSAIPVYCWWLTGLTIYLLLCYLWWGPMVSRSAYRNATYKDIESDMIFIGWLFSPFTVPFLLLFWVFHRPINWLVYGSSK